VMRREHHDGQGDEARTSVEASRSSHSHDELTEFERKQIDAAVKS